MHHFHLGHIERVDVLNPGGYVLAPIPGKTSPGMGYLFGLGALWGWRRKRKVYDFRLDPERPLTLCLYPGGWYCQPDRHEETDLGSVPELCEPWLPRNSYEDGFVIHDSACHKRGLYFASQIEGPYTFCPIDSDTAHRLLGLTVRAMGAWPITQFAIYRAVRHGGPQWECGDLPPGKDGGKQ